MFSFRVQGFAGSCDSYWSDSPIDVAVFAETEAEAIKKVEAVTGKELSALHRKITTIEAEPVKHGRWELRHVGHGHYWECSNCHTNPCIYVTKDTNYCPNCGCKMDLEET